MDSVEISSKAYWVFHVYYSIQHWQLETCREHILDIWNLHISSTYSALATIAQWRFQSRSLLDFPCTFSFGNSGPVVRYCTAYTFRTGKCQLPLWDIFALFEVPPHNVGNEACTKKATAYTMMVQQCSVLSFLSHACASKAAWLTDITR